MSYSYATERAKLFTESGQVMFLAVRDRTKVLLDYAGAARLDKMLDTCGGGDSWTMLACVDRLVELGEIVEVTPADSRTQNKVYVRKP